MDDKDIKIDYLERQVESLESILDDKFASKRRIVCRDYQLADTQCMLDFYVSEYQGMALLYEEKCKELEREKKSNATSKNNERELKIELLETLEFIHNHQYEDVGRGDSECPECGAPEGSRHETGCRVGYWSMKYELERAKREMHAKQQ